MFLLWARKSNETEGNSGRKIFHMLNMQWVLLNERAIGLIVNRWPRIACQCAARSLSTIIVSRAVLSQPHKCAAIKGAKYVNSWCICVAKPPPLYANPIIRECANYYPFEIWPYFSLFLSPGISLTSVSLIILCHLRDCRQNNVIIFPILMNKSLIAISADAQIRRERDNPFS